MLFAGLIIVAIIYGLMCAILPLRFLVIPLVPVLVMVGMILWLMPDLGSARLDYGQKLFLWFIGLNIMWPNYVAFYLPGLPWITPTRFVVFAVLAIFLFAVATSSKFRSDLGEMTGSVPSVRALFWLFWAATVISLAFARDPSTSFNKFANNQIFWTMMFLASTYFATREGFVTKTAKILVVTLFAAMMLGLYEYKIQKVFWIEQLPFFLRVDPEFLDRVIRTQSRAGTDIYRVRGTMATSLYFAEYLAVIFPLAVHVLFRSRTFLTRAAVGFGVAGTIVVMYLTNARSAMVGMLLTLLIYPFFVAWRRRVRSPRSLLATAVLAVYPVGVVAVALIVVFWRRAHVAVLGGGQHASSSEARNVQWAMGMPKILKGPLGHGAASSGEVLGYANGAGELTVDTYYLSVMLDYGLLALPIFVLMFSLPLWYGFQAHNRANSEEEVLIAPLVVGLFNFVVIKSVLSSEGSFPIAFIMLGCVLGLIWRQNRADAAGFASTAKMVAPKRT
jgi:hypothetical protein